MASASGVVKAEVATAAMAPTVLPTGLAEAAEVEDDLTLVGSDPRRTCPPALFLSSFL